MEPTCTRYSAPSPSVGETFAPTTLYRVGGRCFVRRWRAGDLSNLASSSSWEEIHRFAVRLTGHETVSEVPVPRAVLGRWNRHLTGAGALEAADAFAGREGESVLVLDEYGHPRAWRGIRPDGEVEEHWFPAYKRPNGEFTPAEDADYRISRKCGTIEAAVEEAWKFAGTPDKGGIAFQSTTRPAIVGRTPEGIEAEFVYPMCRTVQGCDTLAGQFPCPCGGDRESPACLRGTCQIVYVPVGEHAVYPTLNMEAGPLAKWRALVSK